MFYEESGCAMKWLIRFALQKTYRAIVLGESLRATFDRLVPPDRVVVIPNGIPDFAAGNVREPATCLRVVYLGTLTLEKGVGLFVQAALDVLSKTDNVEFVVAGPWWRESNRDTVQSLLSASPHGTKIQFVGEVSGKEKRDLLQRADLFVFPSIQQEGLPLTVLEAMCAGLAVIASDRGCVREIVQDGITGFIVPPGDAGALVKKILKFTAHPSLGAQLGQAGRRAYEQSYRDEVFAGRMTALMAESARNP
jgi:glycosyltransferase involved in cell wall biosynthesis